MEQLTGKTSEGISYNYYKCQCGEEILDMNQLHKVAEKYREIKQYRAKLTRWGKSLGLRIPKDLEKKYFENNKEVNLIPEKDGLKLVPV
ncbi:hypothetical protein ACFLTH_04855 [Bacteroidota bacterium]